MIKLNDTLGRSTLTNEYFVGLVTGAIKDCYGVAGIAAADTADSVMSAVLGEKYTCRGVAVEKTDDGIEISLHICVMYGISIHTIADNVRERVHYAVENATGLKIGKINIYVDDIVTE